MGIMRRNHMKCDLAKYFDLPGSLEGAFISLFILSCAFVDVDFL